MNLVYQGKTKDVYELDNKNYLLKFKDDVTGVDGVFDPGANSVGLSIEGMGKGGLRMTEYYFKKLQQQNIPTHFVDADVEKQEMTVLPATSFGKGIEIICRFKAVGSFMRRYGAYATQGQALDAFVEVTLKDDDREDPPITKDALAMLGILSAEEYETLKSLTQQISTIIKEDLQEKGLELYDIKLEFGRNEGNIILMDEISGGNMRVYKEGKIVEPLELVKLIFND